MQLLQTPVGIEFQSEAISSYVVEGFINYDAEDGNQGRFMFQPPSAQLSDNYRQQLQREVRSTWTSSNFGTDMHLKGLHIVQEYSFDSSIQEIAAFMFKGVSCASFA